MGSLGLYELFLSSALCMHPLDLTQLSLCSLVGFRVAFRGLCYIRLLVAGVEKEYPFE